jgi:hypothetical protein
MVSKITIIELHFDGAQFGPATIESDYRPDTGGAEEEGDAEERGGEGDEEHDTDERGGSKSPVVTFLQGATVFVLMFGFLWIVLSRLLSGEEADE